MQPIYPLEVVGGGGAYPGNKIFSNNFNSIHIGGGGATTTSSNPPGFISSNNAEPQMYYNNSSYVMRKLTNASDQENIKVYNHSNIKKQIPLTNPQSQL